MGLKCNELESTLKDEVNYEDKQRSSSSLTNTSRKRRKHATNKLKSFLHTLFKWYFKSRALHDEFSQAGTNDYEISIENISALNCSDDEASLAYRQHKYLQQIRTSTTKISHAPSSSSSNLSHSHYLVRQSICLYAASSVILALCYLATPSSATTDTSSHPVFSDGKSDKEILDHLLRNSRYDKRLLPPVDGTLTVNVSVLLLSLASPDESSLKYEVEFLLQQQWYDPRLRYANQSQYEFLNAIHHHEDIWLPDTYFIMHGDFKDPIIPMHFALRIYRNGTINYLMRRHLILSCQGSLNIFPFDDPLCSFALESISYEQSAITYVWKNDEDTLRKSPSLTTLNAYLIQNQTIACEIKGSWRGVTTMLNFFTTSNGFRSTLPVGSNLTAMNVWDGVCMCFIYASLLEFVCVNYVGRKRPLHNVVYRPGENPVTQRLPEVLSRFGMILAMNEKKRDAAGPNEMVACTSCGGNSPCTHSANNGCATETCFVQVRKKEPPHPIRVAKTIDVIAR
ncbi:CLUMA_CG016337, isoform A [Clunio marinus]|uniref:CLUMA_CG016337, isoform A n=1 Tax=Clunio marinus TaxID=568069 RepID=A0A1J1ISU8_9DIPT|nr:CLUMA_CG016337, isoform A [Clunio marinus]